MSSITRLSVKGENLPKNRHSVGDQRCQRRRPTDRDLLSISSGRRESRKAYEGSRKSFESIDFLCTDDQIPK